MRTDTHLLTQTLLGRTFGLIKFAFERCVNFFEKKLFTLKINKQN
jgi:hypothetical protein